MAISDVLRRVDEREKTRVSRHRSAIRKAVMAAVADIKGIQNWESQDDTMLDALDNYLEVLVRINGRAEASLSIAPTSPEDLTSQE